MERFMELYQTVYQDLYRLAYFYLGNAADAEDAVQETALAACEHFEKLKNQEERLMVVLRVFGGYKSEEIARILNKNHSTVRSRYRRALKKLERELEQGKEKQGGSRKKRF